MAQAPGKNASATAKSNAGTSAKAEERIAAKAWIFGLMLAFLAATALVAWAVYLDASDRQALETLSQPTAVGDPVTLVFDSKENPAKEILRWKGEPYFLQTNQAMNLSDGSVLKVARDDSGQIQLYRARRQREERLVLVKLAPDRFLVLTPR